MTKPLSPNTQAILLLTAPLIVGRGAQLRESLTQKEYRQLARVLHENNMRPSDLLGPDASEVIELCSSIVERARLKSLLNRGLLLSQALERWQARGIWVLSRADEEYPGRLKAKLKDNAPPILYGCGHQALLEDGGLAVVGSRHVDLEITEYAERVGQLCAEAGINVVSGAARGIDRASMNGALSSGGRALGVMADSLQQGALANDNRELLLEGRLTLISPYDPAAGFDVGNAMQRNKLIYALSDAALVVSSDLETGGTWAGAIEQLDRLRLVPLFVRRGTGGGEGNVALLKRGGKVWPEPNTAHEISETLTMSQTIEPQADTHDAAQLGLFDQVAAQTSAG